MDEQIIYIIIAIVYFVVTALTSKKKKAEKEARRRKAQSQPQPQTEREEGDEPMTMEDILGELFEKAEDARPVKTPETVKEPVEVKDTSMSIEFKKQQEFLRRAEQARKRNEALRQKESKNVQKKEFDYNAGEGSVTSDKKKPAVNVKIFGKTTIREAIIAKAILDRPYT